ncbi:MAG: hypothetical protein COT91_01775 [Candidatus Doudnabacteria bacterium CG10_big_fil_rev_8_21_14_0_10_41_10]|uniref:Uncharacterized protein n=1 Tax=Candidatus Doudnabacteria bacterium CG10_big_fil_rev_8_21_14_0_10_41_10 TaxID=1974551 RepID=A0A2H0VE41_9BACT|nr:MAG: hypothetical protein COT91_01775 [Candidatus Doudnabacteria bacterium CG10_big_fil_rev_8_21_14_0_10_41_10]
MVIMGKIRIVILTVVLLAGLVFTGWLFFSRSQTVELAEGQSFEFKNYSIRTEVAGEDGKSVQIRVFDNTSKTIEYLYLSEADGYTQEVLGLVVEFQGAGVPNGFNQRDEKVVKLKLNKK